MTFMNKLRAKKRRKRLNLKKERQQLRGSNYNDKMKAKVCYKLLLLIVNSWIGRNKTK